MPWLPKVLSVVPISAAIILLAASSTGCDDCKEVGEFVEERCPACCDADATCQAVGYVGDANRAYVCTIIGAPGSMNNNRGSGFRLTGP